MATTTSPGQANPEPLLEQHRNIAYGLFWSSGLLALLTWWLALRFWDGSALVVIGSGLLALATLALGVWQVQAFSADPPHLRQRRKQLSLALLVAAGLLVLLLIWLGAQQGLLAAFPEISTALVLAIIAAGTAVVLRGEPGDSSRQEALLRALVRQRQLLVGILFGLAIALGVVAVIVFMNYRSDGLPEWGMAALLTGVMVEACIWLLVSASRGLTTSQIRIGILVVGGQVGLIVAVMTGLRARLWWDEVFAGGVRAWQGPQAWRLWLCFYLELLGLATIFGSLLLGRVDIRTNPLVRRLLFGYNSVLTGLLLLAILVVINVSVYASYPYTFEWTKDRGLYAMEERSKRQLESLSEQVKIYVTIPPNHVDYRNVRNLLDNAEAVTNKLTVEYISPDLQHARFQELLKKYPKMAEQEPRGLLIVYGPETLNKQPPHAFISARQLSKRNRTDDNKEVHEFLGEDLLMTELRFLVRDQERPVIYFSQGFGELDINDPRFKSENGAGILVDKLKRDRYDVRGLLWGPPQKGLPLAYTFTKKAPEEPHVIPADAEMLVIAQPRIKYPPDVLEALEGFVQKGGKLNKDDTRRGGKLLVFANLQVRPDFTPGETGIEDFVKRYGVEMTNDIILHYGGQHAPWFNLAAPPQRSDNPIAKNLANQDFLLFLARHVGPVPGAGTYTAETILEVRSPPNDRTYWAETDLRVRRDPGLFVRTLTEPQMRAKISTEPISVGVAVSRPGGQPVMVVYGDAYLASNDEDSLKYNGLTLPVNSVEWLMGRPENIGIKPRESGFYALRQSGTNFNRMLLLPICLVVLTLVGLGAGVWLVRQR